MNETPLPPHLLIVDDDDRLRALLVRFFSEQGFLVTDAADAADARRKLEFFLFDAAIIDVMMPGEDGRLLTRWIKAEQKLPILLLTAMADVEERIMGLEAGADDYVAKPFEPRELLLRVKNVLKRQEISAPAAPEVVAFGPYTFEIEKLNLQKNGQSLPLTLSEAILLKELARQLGHPVSRADLARKSQGNFSEERSVDVQVTRLRRKIEPEPGRPQFLLTVRGEGYVLKA